MLPYHLSSHNRLEYQQHQPRHSFIIIAVFSNSSSNRLTFLVNDTLTPYTTQPHLHSPTLYRLLPSLISFPCIFAGQSPTPFMRCHSFAMPHPRPPLHLMLHVLTIWFGASPSIPADNQNTHRTTPSILDHTTFHTTFSHSDLTTLSRQMQHSIRH